MGFEKTHTQTERDDLMDNWSATIFTSIGSYLSQVKFLALGAYFCFDSR